MNALVHVAKRDAPSRALAVPHFRQKRVPLVPRRVVRSQRRRQQELGAASRCVFYLVSNPYKFFYTMQNMTINLQLKLLYLQIKPVFIVCGDALLLSKSA